MSDRPCPYETAVVESARTGVWESGLRAHVRGCAACTESARVTEWIADVATQLGRDQSVPDPTYIWLKAEIERRAKVENSLSWQRLGTAALPGLAVGLFAAAAMLAVLSEVSAIAIVVSTWLSTTIAESSLVDRTVFATIWLGFPLLLTATYLLVFRLIR
ncbi:MAG TPA: hypothetical protein VKQ06_12730 [Gammaproteobacteria bacterium]|nr:hypothetical protein [Gammaproteobacteria bacterium]